MLLRVSKTHKAHHRFVGGGKSLLVNDMEIVIEAIESINRLDRYISK